MSEQKLAGWTRRTCPDRRSVPASAPRGVPLSYSDPTLLRACAPFGLLLMAVSTRRAAAMTRRGPVRRHRAAPPFHSETRPKRVLFTPFVPAMHPNEFVLYK